MVRKIHFYKAHSRYGMRFFPIHSSELNIGVEQGPDSILSDNFLKSFPFDTQISEFYFPDPETITCENYFKEFINYSDQLTKLINSNLASNECQVFLGGDHSTAFSSLNAVLERYNPKRVGYIQFDSHADINLVSSSPTGNIHGMFLRPFITDFDEENINNYQKNKLNPENIIYIGNLELDPEEKKLLEEKNIKNYGHIDLENNFEEIERQICKLLERIDHLHISFDIDVFDAKFVKATGTPSIDGLDYAEIAKVLRLLNGFKSISLDLVEVNPLKAYSHSTIILAQKIITYIIDLVSHQKLF